MMFLYVARSLLIIILFESASMKVCGFTIASLPPPNAEPSAGLSTLTSSIECRSNLRNIAVYEGDQDILMNLTSVTNNVWWKLVPTSDEFSTITIQDNRSYRNPSFIRLFLLNEIGLVITKATTVPGEYPISTSGLYIAQCLDNANMTAAAKLLVVTSAPNCTCNGSSPEVVQLSCTIVFADFTLHPIEANMTWINGDVVYKTDNPRRTRINYFVYESTSTITVENSVSENFTCVVNFNAPTDIEYDFIATNAPEFSASCSVEVCGTTTTSTPLATSTTPSPTTATLSSTTTTKTKTPSTSATTLSSSTTTTTKTPSTSATTLSSSTTTTTRTPSTTATTLSSTTATTAKTPSTSATTLSSTTATTAKTPSTSATTLSSSTTTITRTPSTTATTLSSTTATTAKTPSTTATTLSSSTTTQTPSTTTLLQRRTTPLRTTNTPIITIPSPTSTTETQSSSTTSIFDEPTLTSKRYTKILSTTTTVAPSRISASTTKAPETYSVFDQPTISKRYTKVLSTTTTARTATSSTKAIRDDDHLLQPSLSTQSGE